MKIRIIPILCLLMTGCGAHDDRWWGYALRDRVGVDETRLIGTYGSLEGCRRALLASDSDASSEALVCTKGCSMSEKGFLDTCEATSVVRAVQTPLTSQDDVIPDARPPAGEVRSRGNGSSPP